jgi:putative membrane protein
MLAEYFLWLKAFHLLAVISWMAGIFYLPRLFVYHAGAAIGSETSELFKTMERRLLIGIMRPAGIATLISGPLLVLSAGFDWGAGWLAGKGLAVLGLIIFHLFLETWRLSFGRDERVHSAKFFRVINEVPTLLLILIVGFVVLKP